MRENQVRSLEDWKPIDLQELKRKFPKELYEDVLTLTQYCKSKRKTWSLDILRQKKVILIAVVMEDMSWVYETEDEKDPYFRQIYLSRGDCSFLIRKMNEKRTVRRV